MQTGIDCAWRSRVSSFYSGAEAAAIIARASGQAPAYDVNEAWRAQRAYLDKAAAQERNACARPFRFEDLNGEPEPEKWGPKYSKPVKRARFNDETNIPTNCASGQKRCFDAAKHRAKLRAEFAALANADKREWALGKSKNDRGETIEQAYALAMKAKRARLEALELEEAA
jgi:hypothetical protein